MSKDSIIKPCTADQLDELVTLSKHTFSETFAHLNDPAHFTAYTEKAFSRKQIAQELENPESAFYFIYHQDELAGYLKLNTGKAQSDIRDADSLEIERIYVDQRYQGLGLGKALFEFSLDQAKAQNQRYIWLGVWEQNTKAINFYKSLGFYQFAKHPFKLGDDLQTDYLMRLDL